MDLFKNETLKRVMGMGIAECIGALKESGFIRESYDTYLQSSKSEFLKLCYHRVFNHLVEFDNGAGVSVMRNKVKYLCAYLKGEDELVIATYVS